MYIVQVHFDEYTIQPDKSADNPADILSTQPISYLEFGCLFMGTQSPLTIQNKTSIPSTYTKV